MQKIITLIFTLLCSTILFSQTTVQVKPGTQGAQEEYRIENSKIDYSPIIEGESVLTNISYVWNETINSSSKQLATTSTLNYTVPEVGSEQGTLVDIAVRVMGTSIDTLVNDLDTTIHYQIYVFKKPVVTQTSYDKALYSGDETTLTFTHTGGKSDAWSYEWSDGTINDSSIFKATQAAEYTVTVKVSNKLAESVEAFTDTLTYSIKVYDACDVNDGGNTITSRFGGQSVTYTPQASGGDSNKWTYEWYVDGVKKDITTASFKYDAPNDEKQSIIKVVVTNSPDNIKNVYSKELTYTMQSYKQPSVNTDAFDAVLFEGDNTTLSFTQSGGKGDGWSYEWSNGNTSKTYTYNATVDGNDTISVTVKNTLGMSDKSLDYSKTLNYVIKVWEKCNVEQGENAVAARYGTQKIMYAPKATGGDDTKWKYEWYVDGAKQTTTFAYFEYTVPNSEKQSIIKVVATNSPANIKKAYSKELTYTLKSYTQPEVKIAAFDTKLFVDDQTKLSFVQSGGKSDSWTYAWSDNVTTSKDYTFKANQAGERTIKVLIKNSLGNVDKELDFDTTLIYNISAWTKGSVTKAAFKDIVYHGKSQTLSINTEGGYPDGWTCKWTKVGESTILSDELSWKLTPSNNTSGVQTQTYQVEWKNAIDNKVGAQGIETFKIDVYPKVVAPTFSYEHLQMRDIESKEVEVTKGSGGNPNGWFYSWDGEQATNNFKHIFNQTINSTDKKVVEESLSLHWENRSPDGTEIWESNNLKLKVTIYNTPKQPVLKVKGNGTSNIYIIDDMGMTEDELWKKGYYFQFWDGVSLVSEVSDQRWCRYENTPHDAWAQSVWYYDDGFACASEPVKASNVQYVASPGSGITIYQLDGECVMHRIVDDMAIVESIYAGLNAGIYIVRIDCDGVSNTHKIVIR